MTSITSFSGLKHPNIVLFLGVHTGSDGVVSIVTEYLAKGSLLTLLHEDGGSFSDVQLLKM